MCYLYAARDAELRQLRKQTTELEEQNAVLSKHLDNLRGAVDRLQTETTQQRSCNSALAAHLHTIRTTLASRFASLPLPGNLKFMFKHVEWRE